MYQLAVRLGKANVDALARSLTAKQFLAWEAYASLEPFNQLWEDYRFASIVCEIRNALRGEKQAPYTLDDCLIKIKESEEPKKPKQPQTFEEQIAIAHIWAKAAAKIHQERKGAREE